MPAATTPKVAVPPTATTWSAGADMMVGGMRPDHSRALTMSFAPSVLETQKPALASLEGGKKFKPTTRPGAWLVEPTSGWPLFQCATCVAPGAMLMGVFKKLSVPPLNELTPSRSGLSGKSATRVRFPGAASLDVVNGKEPLVSRPWIE